MNENVYDTKGQTYKMKISTYFHRNPDDTMTVQAQEMKQDKKRYSRFCDYSFLRAEIDDYKKFSKG